MNELDNLLDEAERHEVPVITTVEAFHKEPELLYEFLNRAANRDIEVVMAPIKTTDKTHANS